MAIEQPFLSEVCYHDPDLAFCMMPDQEDVSRIAGIVHIKMLQSESMTASANFTVAFEHHAQGLQRAVPAGMDVRFTHIAPVGSQRSIRQ